MKQANTITKPGQTRKKQPVHGMLGAMRDSLAYRRMDGTERAALQQRRMRRMVAWAKANSPFYRALYDSVPESFALTDLPPVNKQVLMAHWNEWVTNPDITLEQVGTFMENPDNIGRKLAGRYLVFTTSGSTGHPLVSLCDPTTNHVMGAVNVLRSFARKEDLKALMRRGGKVMGVFATGGFYLGNSSVRARLIAMPWKKRQMAVTSALLPIGEIVRQLNAFQPAMLGGYPSNLDLLVDEAKAGRLDISPVLVMTGGEYLSDEVRHRLADAFGCHVQTSYACTEGGTLACECRERHFHINDDWVIVEPVDNDNRPVPDGTLSDKILLTNLFNFTQPYIRYEVTDRVIRHREPCACGNPSPWLELEGRSDDVVRLEEKGAVHKLAPLALYATLREVAELRRFQLVAHPGNWLELRVDPMDGMTVDEAFGKAHAALQAFLSKQGITSARIVLSAEVPRQQAGSGKFKHIIQEEPEWASSLPQPAAEQDSFQNRL